MNYKASLEIYKGYEALHKCLLLEKVKQDRSSVTIKKAKDHLKIDIAAKDATALRATLNAITQLLAVHNQIGELK